MRTTHTLPRPEIVAQRLPMELEFPAAAAKKHARP